MSTTCGRGTATMKLLTVLSLLAITLSVTESVMVCYYASWAGYRDGDGQCNVDNIDPNICTHVVYIYAGLGSDNKIKVLDPWNDLCEDWGRCGYDLFTSLKIPNPELITQLAVGGYDEPSKSYSDMAADPAKRQTFITSTVELLKAHDFDGLDLVWEYPTLGGGVPADRENYISLLSELHEALHANDMILTVGVSASKYDDDKAYDIPAMVDVVDLVNVMTYDLHGPWEQYTHHQSPLYAYKDDHADALYFNQDFCINYWIDGGMPSTKLTLGIPLYGRCWTLDDPDQHGYYAPASRPGKAGPLTQTEGMMGYNEICDFINKDSWTVVVEEGCNEPYTYNMAYGNIWCSYEDHDSCVIKANYAKEKNLAGLMVWTIDTDDFHAECTTRDFDLIRTLADTFVGTIRDNTDD
ncbi:chitinase-3-like protein 1 [Homarus americanus]|uniref:chitinase-3-like protein 1 n=1 Tax=Homarus americanus TaxID=6706 RepID=UPI001C4547AF|nr:chitinase-3-like protein 1 [Homarus americanus]